MERVPGRVGDKVSHEVATIEVLQRRAALYPEPTRTELDTIIREYARAVADKEWPEQRVGRHPSAAKAHFSRLNLLLGDFEPKNLPDQMVHAETLRELTAASEARRARIHATAYAPSDRGLAGAARGRRAGAGGGHASS